MTGPRSIEPVQIDDFFRGPRPRAAERGKLCEVSNCSHIAFVSLTVARKQRQLCLTHYEVLSQGFSESSGQERTA